MKTRGIILFVISIFSALVLKAQTVSVKDSLIVPKYMLGMNFFKEFPKDAGQILGRRGFELYDDQKHKVLAMDLKENAVFTHKDSLLIIPPERVLNREQFILAFKQQTELMILVKTNKTPAISQGNKMPVFSVKDTKGKVWNNKNTLGKPLVLNFWNIFCGPCIREMPDLNKWMTDIPNANYLAVTYYNSKQIEHIVTTRPFLFNQITEDKRLWSAFGIEQNPTTVLIDKRGIVRYIEIGTNEEKRTALKEKLLKLSQE